MRSTLALRLIFACLALGCNTATAPDPEPSSDDAKPAPTAPPATAAELKEPTLASAMHGGECNSQADCPAGAVCTAVMPGVATCVAERFADGPAMQPAPNGRPGAPVGLLDGQVLRDQVMREQPVPPSEHP